MLPTPATLIMLATLAGLLGACAAPGGARGAAEPTPSATAPATVLTITLAPAKTAPVHRWTLSCQPAAGSHPHPATACAYVAKTPATVLRRVPGHEACSMIFGGPQVATVKGTWRGVPVDARLSRANGCEIARWDKLKPLIGG